MHYRDLRTYGLLTAALCVGGAAVNAQGGPDWGRLVQQQMLEHAATLFGVGALGESAVGPFSGPAVEALDVAAGLRVSLVSSAVETNTDMIAMWPNDRRPTHLFVCNEDDFDVPAVQRVDLSKPANANATTILQGLSSCDPIRRTPWGTIVVGEEEDDGGLYEILQPASINTPIQVTNRTTGATSDPARVAKRKAVGQVAFEGIVLLEDGTMYFGDELRPGDEPGSRLGGAIYKFIPTNFYYGPVFITNLNQSPLAAGTVLGLQVGVGDFGQGTEIGKGKWVPIKASDYADVNGNLPLRNAQKALYFTGYYRPEDMELDPLELAHGDVRLCWANTGRMSNGGGSLIEPRAIYGEIMCVEDLPANGGPIPQVIRFVQGDPQANHFDNLAFQPVTGNLVILEDGGVNVVLQDGSTEQRGNDMWMCLPDGRDQNLQSDGCIRFASLKDTASESTGFIFTADGTTAYVSLQHRATGEGALLKITGFKTRRGVSRWTPFGHDNDGFAPRVGPGPRR